MNDRWAVVRLRSRVGRVRFALDCHGLFLGPRLTVNSSVIMFVGEFIACGLFLRAGSVVFKLPNLNVENGLVPDRPFWAIIPRFLKLKIVSNFFCLCFCRAFVLWVEKQFVAQ